ncbi:uncharacterized protein LOC136081227 [Hydra vulgaris]|uniref:Uncharacterized protein LOC136081227 n=1 Tax=Hydra vulgaris TaxID=6087 RepID=A0ABM4BZB2_HYDVU
MLSNPTHQSYTFILIDQLNKDDSYRCSTKLTISETKTLIELCLHRCYFLWNNEIHELENSGPIGLSFMVVLAESFLQHHEENAFKIAKTLNPPFDLKSYLRYVDDSHARFSNIQEAEKFKIILNKQHPAIQYTIETENHNKTLNFLDITIINNSKGKYEFKVYRKEAITNIQIKPHSNHDPKILCAIFKGYVHRAYSICSVTHLKNEINFLIQVFNENGYTASQLKSIANQIRKKRYVKNNRIQSENNAFPTVSLPWIPSLLPKLRKIFRKVGYRVVFKSNPNLRTILTCKNKSRLPLNSQPGTYLVECNCSKKFVGETKLQIKTRIQQHQKSLNDGKHHQSAIATHSKFCSEKINWEIIKTLKVETKKFDRKVQEALEIQRHQCFPSNGGINLDNGQFVNTKFWTPFFIFLRNEKRSHSTADVN